MKLAETDLLGADGPRPIVLLDDVFSELDPDRAARLSELLARRGQVIVTTADPGTLDAARQRRRGRSGASLTAAWCARDEHVGAGAERPGRPSSAP